MIQSESSFSFSSLAVTAALKIRPRKSFRQAFSRVNNRAEENSDLRLQLKEMPSSNLTSRWDVGGGFSWQ